MFDLIVKSYRSVLEKSFLHLSHHLISHRYVSKMYKDQIKYSQRHYTAWFLHESQIYCLIFFSKKYTQMSSYQKGFKFEVPTTYTKDKVLLLLSFNPLSPLDFSSVRVEHQTYNNSSQIIKHALPSAILPNNKNET